jgi:hypothetical protein
MFERATVPVMELVIPIKVPQELAQPSPTVNEVSLAHREMSKIDTKSRFRSKRHPTNHQRRK